MREIVSLAVQSCIGLIFAIYGIYSFSSNRKANEGKKVMLSIVCILVGMFLLGYVVYQIL